MSESLAKAVQTLFGSLQNNKKFSKRRKLRSDISDQKNRRVNSFKYHRRIWQKGTCRHL